MSCQYNLLFLFLCGFAELSVSAETCGKDLLVGTSCIIKLKTQNNVKPPEIKWTHDRTPGYILRWKGGKLREISEGLSMEEDGSLKFSSVRLNDTGKYTFNTFNDDGAEIGKGEVEIKVYEKAPKPSVKLTCTKDGSATLSCDIGKREDLTLSWYKEDKMIQNEKNAQLSLSSTQVQENKPYSCEAHNPVSREKSERITVSCPGPGPGLVSAETCGKDLVVGTSCIIKLKTQSNVKPSEIKWTHDRTTGYILHWKGGTVKDKSEGVSMEEDGSLKFSSVSLKDTGKYTFYTFNADGADISKGEVEIKVYEKAPKPSVKLTCTKDGNATLSCDIGKREDLTLSWYKEDKMIQNEKNAQLSLSSTQVQENKPYSCEAHNPVSREKSERITVSCSGPGLGKLFGFDFWVMVSILSGGGALLLLLICVLIICACRPARPQK